MAFNAQGLILINSGGTVPGTPPAPGNVKNIYAYATNDAPAVVEADGYFDDIPNDPLNAGDVIIASMDVDGTPVVKTYGVAVGGGDVTIREQAGKKYLTVDIADLSAEASYFVVSPVAGDISKLFSVIDGAVSTADVTVTARIGGVAVTNGVLTIATSGSAAGDVDIATPTAARTVAAGGAIELLVTGGGSGGSPRGHVTIEISPSVAA